MQNRRWGDDESDSDDDDDVVRIAANALEQVAIDNGADDEDEDDIIFDTRGKSQQQQQQQRPSWNHRNDSGGGSQRNYDQGGGGGRGSRQNTRNDQGRGGRNDNFGRGGGGRSSQNADHHGRGGRGAAARGGLHNSNSEPHWKQLAKDQSTLLKSNTTATAASKATIDGSAWMASRRAKQQEHLQAQQEYKAQQEQLHQQELVNKRKSQTAALKEAALRIKEERRKEEEELKKKQVVAAATTNKSSLQSQASATRNDLSVGKGKDRALSSKTGIAVAKPSKPAAPTKILQHADGSVVLSRKSMEPPAKNVASAAASDVKTTTSDATAAVTPSTNESTTKLSATSARPVSSLAAAAAALEQRSSFSGRGRYNGSGRDGRGGRDFSGRGQNVAAALSTPDGGDEQSATSHSSRTSSHTYSKWERVPMNRGGGGDDAAGRGKRGGRSAGRGRGRHDVASVAPPNESTSRVDDATPPRNESEPDLTVEAASGSFGFEDEALETEADGMVPRVTSLASSSKLRHPAIPRHIRLTC
ncbi:hypothetical protein MPSEU_000262900 [Mayamaea pseudoterrestris]|nr:hypothetical protein MPSEU_000262900 [Mayamaea pseudoterrestris]